MATTFEATEDALAQHESQPLIWQLADSMFEVRAEDLAEKTWQEAEWCVLDTLGCIVSGTEHPDALAFDRAEAPVFASEGPGAVIRDARRWAFQGDIFELNDLVGGHASIGTVSLLLAEALHNQQIRIKDLVLAAAVGIETTTRLFEAHSWEKKAYAETGIVVTSVLSSVGAAAGLGRLLGLNRDEYRQALAIACATAGWGPSEVIFGQGGLIKPSQFGSGPAEIGYRGVLKARAGLTGPPRVLESPMGFFATVAYRYDRDLLLGGSGWRLEHAQRKLHACCGYIHATLDALNDLRCQGHNLSRVARIVVEVPPAVFEAVAKGQDPVSANDARFHLRYIAALVVAGHYPIRPEHSSGYANFLGKQDIIESMSKIELRTLEDVPKQEGNRFNSSRVTVQHEDPKHTATTVCDTPRGTFRNPLSAAELTNKFMDLTAPHISADMASRLISVLTQDTDTLSEESAAQGPDPHDDLRQMLRQLTGRSAA